MRSRSSVLCCIAAAIVAVVPLVPALALSFVTTRGDRPFSAEEAKQYAWPKGTLELINHSLRKEGWHFFFSELPNDGNTFGYRVKTVEEANSLIAAAAKVEGTKPSVVLSSERFFRYNKDDKGEYDASFAVGSQKILNEWWERLPAGKQFGVSTYPTPPTVQPPTLILYVGARPFDLKKLDIPKGIKAAAVLPTGEGAGGVGSAAGCGLRRVQCPSGTGRG